GRDVPRGLPRCARSWRPMTRVTLYVEGAAVAQPRRESPLERLWKALAGRVCAAPDVEVVGISKGHIEHLRHEPPAAGAQARLPISEEINAKTQRRKDAKRREFFFLSSPFCVFASLRLCVNLRISELSGQVADPFP